MTINTGKRILVLIAELAIVTIGLFWVRDQLASHTHHEVGYILPILVDIAMLTTLASFGGKLARIMHVAPMAGMIVLGIIAGPAILGMLQPTAIGVELARLVGVLFIMFEAGLHFDLTQLKKHAKQAITIAVVAVLLEVLLFLVGGLFLFHFTVVQLLFISGIFMASSVGLVLEAMNRCKKPDKELAVTIISTVLVADILAVAFLSTITEVASGNFHAHVLLRLIVSLSGFVIATFFLWKKAIADKIVSYLNRYYDHNIEATYTRFFFGAVIGGAVIAAILGLEPLLGAFGMGVVLSKIDDGIKHDAWQKIEGYIHVFVGGFLVSIGTMLPREGLFDTSVWIVALIFGFLAFIGKYIPATLLSKKHGSSIGYALNIRGEVGLAFVTVGIANHILPIEYLSAAIIAIIGVTVISVTKFGTCISAEPIDEPEVYPQLDTD